MLVFALPACDDREPPQINDDQLRAEIRDDFQVVQQSSAERSTDISRTIDEARAQIDIAIERSEDISTDVFTLD